MIVSARYQSFWNSLFYAAVSGRKEGIMKEIFEQYGGVLITVVAVLALIVVITFLIGTNGDSAVGSAFQELIQSFIERANENL